VQEALSSGAISEGHARALLGLEREEQQEVVLRTVIREELTVRKTEELVRRMAGEQTRRKTRAAVASPQTRALEAEFRRALGTKVSLRRSGQSGRLTIFFYSEEELEALYDAIVRGGPGGGVEHETD
jgi:ParB family chromosome partitioning protein